MNKKWIKTTDFSMKQNLSLMESLSYGFIKDKKISSVTEQKTPHGKKKNTGASKGVLSALRTYNMPLRTRWDSVTCNFFSYYGIYRYLMHKFQIL